MKLLEYYLIYLVNFIITAMVFGVLDFILDNNLSSLPILMIATLIIMNSVEYSKK